MPSNFNEFWRLYAPPKEYYNRYQACRKYWEGLSAERREQILRSLREECVAPCWQEGGRKNPYFYLVDWQPPQPRWLTPNEVWYLQTQHIPLAVCRDPQSGRYGTLVKTEAEKHGLEIHHCL